MRSFNVSEAMWTIGILKPMDLTKVANDALMEGFDTCSLRLLAGLNCCDNSEKEKLFKDCQKELGRPELSKENAMRMYIRYVSKKIIERKISPDKGALFIWDALIAASLPNFHEGDAFIYALSEQQDRPHEKEFFLEEIMKEARSWDDQSEKH